MAAKRPAPEPLEATTQSPTTKRPKNDGPPATLEAKALDTDPVPSEENEPQTAQPATAEPTASAQDDDEEDMEDMEDVDQAVPRGQGDLQGYDDLYLDTINRHRLDFDFEKVCSVSLNNVNVYACLVCGKYFQGRGKKTPAYYHSLELDHHPFIHMTTKAVYILPEGYEVQEVQAKSLDDIKAVVEPQFTQEEVAALDKNKKQHWDLLGQEFTPGFVGMNNIKANDYLNVVIQALSHVTPVRDFFLLADDSVFTHELGKRFAVLVRKIWNPRAFKAHVSPHEFMQIIFSMQLRKQSFTLNNQADPAEFMGWLLNCLNIAIGGHPNKPHTSYIQKIFQGSFKVESQAISARSDGGDRLRFEDREVKSQTFPFTILPLDLPAKPLYKDNRSDNVIPQVALTDILEKYNGITPQEQRDRRMRYRLKHPLPPYLIMHVKRFEKNKHLNVTRNPTIVTFAPKGLDMSPYVEPNPKLHPLDEPITYDLVANITHEGVKIRDDAAQGEAEKKIWRVQVRETGVLRDEKLGDVDRQQWWEMQDLFVDKVSADRLSNKEAYIMIWERRM